jgi:Ca2+-binding EF-hand superfamily protein
LNVYANPKVILEKFDRDGDGKLTYQEFKQIVTPLNRLYNPDENDSQQGIRNVRESFGIPRPEFGSRLPEYLRQSWIDDLKEILYTLSNADALLINERNT